ncbi:Membrane protein [Yarrowia sp. B02]|nr:Membrane protein [Yarrowia sp. B02]
MKCVNLALAVLALGASAEVLKINKNSRQECSGIYNKQDWGGKHDVYIEFTPEKLDTDDWLAFAIFEYRDVDKMGSQIPGDTGIKKYVCDQDAIDSNLCSKEEEGTYIIPKEGEVETYAKIETHRVNLKEPETYRYNVTETGYYCIATYSNDDNYKGKVFIQSAYGYLPGSQIPKHPFYGILSICYLVAFLLWMFSYWQHRSDVLPVQNYITGIFGFLVIEVMFVWSYYDIVNETGDSPGSKAFLVIVSILNSMRNAFTFFLLLIVCLGYGVVKPTLGSLMWKCQALGGIHFVFTLIFTIALYLMDPVDASNVILFLIIPLSITLTTFYIWILSSLTATTKYLVERKQHVKAQMYRNLWWILLGSVIVICGFFFFNALIMTSGSMTDTVVSEWKYRWFLFDGWVNVIYFIDFLLIAFIWRPTANNKRFAMSTELAQDENDAQEFEIGSLAGSDDEDDEERNVGGIPQENPFGDHNRTSIDSMPDHDVDLTRSDTKATLSGVYQKKDKEAKSPEVEATDDATLFALDDEEEDEGESSRKKKGKGGEEEEGLLG